MAKKNLKKYEHWKKEKSGKNLPRTVKGVLKGKKDHVISQDCTADPCNCTGCSDWD